MGYCKLPAGPQQQGQAKVQAGLECHVAYGCMRMYAPFAGRFYHQHPGSIPGDWAVRISEVYGTAPGKPVKQYSGM